MSTKNKIHQARGRGEQAVADITDDAELHEEGERHERAGKLRDAIDKAKDKVEDTIEVIEEKMDRKSRSSHQD